MPIDEGFELEGLPFPPEREGGEKKTNWRGAGWTSPEPGSAHFPRARGGRGVALFFLPSGRSSYDAVPPENEVE